MPNAQNEHYTAGRDYRLGSPHLTHATVFDRLSGMLRERLFDCIDRGMPPTVLEIGAGHGGYTEPVLAAGGRVTAVEMAEASVRQLNYLFGHNEAFAVHHSGDGSLAGMQGEFTLVSAVSVLHHIPDYLGFLTEMTDRVAPGGDLVTLQDPLHYSRLPYAHRFDRAAYLLWRLGRGDLTQGVATQLRRFRGVYDESKLGDTVEYHVVRDGVDELAVIEALSPYFEACQVVPYWSHQSGKAQRLGDRLHLSNTFGIVAKNKRG